MCKMGTEIMPFLDWKNGINCTGIAWDLVTGNGMGNFENGNGISLL